MDTLSGQRILIDGSILSLALGVIIFGSLYYNPRLWLQDYPAEIRAKVPPQTPQERRLQWLLFIPFLAVMLGVPLYSTLQLKAANGRSISFLTAYLNTFLVANIFNLFDAMVIDLLVLSHAESDG